MTTFDSQTLRDLRDRDEVAIRTAKHSESAVVIWLVVADGEVFVRSVRGPKGRWYRDLATGGSATLEAADGWRCRRSRSATLQQSTGPAVNISGSTGRVPMRSRW